MFMRNRQLRSQFSAICEHAMLHGRYRHASRRWGKERGFWDEAQAKPKLALITFAAPKLFLVKITA